MTQNSLRHLLSKDNAHADLVLLGPGLDAHDVSAQGPVGAVPIAGIFDGDLQFRLQLGTVIEVDQRTVQTEIADYGFLVESFALLRNTGNPGSEVCLPPQA